MKINSINILMNYSKIQTKKVSNTSLTQEINQIELSFKGQSYLGEIIKLKQRNEDDFARDFFLKKGKVSKEECEDIIENHPKTLIRAQEIVDKSNKKISQNPNITARAGFSLKRYFDSKYGNNYRLISIGTSPAAITQAVEYLGQDVIYLPASGVQKLDNEGMSYKKRPEIIEIKNINVILKYFKSQIPKNDKKINIPIDFTATGTTLEIITNLLRQHSKLDKNNFIPHSVSETLGAFLYSKDYIPLAGIFINEKELYKILDDCNRQTVEYIANVPHFDIDDSCNQEWNRIGNRNYISSKGKTARRIFKEFKGYSTELARAYSLCMYNELKKMELI